MTDYDMTTVEGLKLAARDIYARLPALYNLVDCHLQIFMLQEIFAVENACKAAPPAQPENGFCPDYDLQACRNLLVDICRLPLDGNDTLHQSGFHIATAVETGKLQAAALFDTIISHDKAELEELAAGVDSDPALLAFWGYHGLRPALVRSAAARRDAMGLDDHKVNGTCPVCGSAPALAVLDDNGSRRLYCSFCWTNWRIKRIQCPFCNGNQQTHNLYFYDEGHPEWRVDVCQSCNSYLKTVNLRLLGRYFYPALENIASLPLDLKAEEEKLQPVNTGWAPGIFV